MWIVYKTSNLTNDKFYIGMHKNKYLDGSFDGYFGSNKELIEQINILGKNCFSRETLIECKDRKEALKKEFETIKDYIVLGCWPCMYNISLGGKWYGLTLNENGYVKSISKQLTLKSIRNLGVTNISQLQYVKLKIQETNKKRRGVAHVLQSQQVKEKITATNLRKYGSKGNQKGKMHIRKVDNQYAGSMIYKDQEIPIGYEKGMALYPSRGKKK